MESRIRAITDATLAALGAAAVSYTVDRPGDLSHGDYAVNAALAAAKALGRKPQEVGSALAEALRAGLGADAARVEVAGPGFVNVTLSAAAVTARVGEALAAGEAWGRGAENAGQRVVIEYSCPNPFKEMHIGHLMSTVIGESIARLTESSGAVVVRDTYGGDVGPHIAKALWALMRAGNEEPLSAAEIGAAYAEGARAYEESAEAKQEIDALNTRLYDVIARQDDAALPEADRALVSRWQHGRELSLEAFRALYRVLDTKFDYYFFESDATPIGLSVVRDGLARGIFEESEGAVIYSGEKKGLHTLVFITSRGTPTYEAKDVGLAFLKEERIPNDRSLILTAAEQSGHFRVLLAALEDIAPLIAKKMRHVPHGFLRLTSGKMSSREGNVITAASVIEDVLVRAAEKNPDPLIAEQVGMAALKYMILRQAPGTDIVFDPEKSLSLDGDSGPYLQYAVVRAKSVIAQAEVGPDISADAPAEPYALARLVARFPEVVARASGERAPQHIAHYLTQLAGAWHSFYAQERIRGGEYEAYKLALAEAFALTMRNGLALLAIPTPEKM